MAFSDRTGTISIGPKGLLGLYENIGILCLKSQISEGQL